MNAGIEIALDVGHSSIGWAVLQTDPSVILHGCGVVTFRADDCLASSRRAYRRQRRHIRSTRQRIARMKVVLAHLRVLTKEELDRPGCAWPWQLAARVLRGGKLLAWPELWDVVRWYAHNRGYDGNRRWSAAEAEAAAEDTEKEENAKTLMQKCGVATMAETFCAICGIDPLGKKRSVSLPGNKRPKGQNAAFPRATVEGEVRRLLRAHFGKLQKLDATLERALLGRDTRDKDAWQAVPCPELKLPARYQGGLLFGQLVPRFDNRIISECPVSGEKVPSRNCAEFYNFRWAMQLANIRVVRLRERELSPLTVQERQELDALMRHRGSMGVEEFKKQVRQIAGAIRDNLDTMLMDPDAKEALLLDPVQELIQSNELKAFWPVLPERLQKRARGQWRRGKRISIAKLRQQLVELGGETGTFDVEVDRQLNATNTRGRKRDKQITREDLLNRPFFVKRLDQRAAFGRDLLKQAFEEVMAGKHPKEPGGCLFITQEMRDAQLTRKIAEQTNNHLVRHRLLILERLLVDIIKAYAGGDKARIAKITIEVNRDLRAMSGMTAKQKAQDLGLRIANHHHVVKKLEEDDSLMKVLEKRRAKITAGLIRKARVADDLDWTCPYTGQRFEPVDLITKRVDKDHIVPRSDRTSDALDSLVITFSAINKWKGNRTAWQFIEQEQGKPVPDLPNLSIMSLSRYKGFVEGLESFRGHDDDKRRKKRRKELMLLPTYEQKQFVPRDLTQTSQLVRLGAAALRKAFLGCEDQPIVVSLPGAVTGAVRKSWKVLGCLCLAAPDVLEECGEVKTKNEIRDITHLHHALDACVLGLASHLIPNNGRVWELIVKRRWNPTEERELRALRIFDKDSEGRLQIRDLDDSLKEQIRQRLAEKRVVQHVPARMDGLPVDQNMWRLKGWTAEGKAILEKHSRDVATGSRKLDKAKPGADNKDRLVGWQPEDGCGKLKRLKAVLITNENFGVALTKPDPVVVPFLKVWRHLQALKAANGGKMPLVVRAGSMVEVPRGTHKGSWRIFSIKNNSAGVAFALGLRDALTHDRSKQNVLVRQLLKDGMEVVKAGFTGPPCPNTS
ncbi:conserved hypothetical protein [Verrucomicrobia bacterium]|nr:conserved hypothetical protein [Verrucomicrobiota bacterium]